MTTQPDALTMWTIYDHPRDFPKHVVVRPIAVLPGELRHYAFACLHDTLDDARETCRDNGASGFLSRDPTDDAVIVETWV